MTGVPVGTRTQRIATRPLGTMHRMQGRQHGTIKTMPKDNQLVTERTLGHFSTKSRFMRKLCARFGRDAFYQSRKHKINVLTLLDKDQVCGPGDVQFWNTIALWMMFWECEVFEWENLAEAHSWSRQPLQCFTLHGKNCLRSSFPHPSHLWAAYRRNPKNLHSSTFRAKS